MPEINDTEEIPEGTFPNSLNNSTKLCITLAPFVSPSYKNIYNEDNDFPKFVLDQHQICCPEGGN